MRIAFVARFMLIVSILIVALGTGTRAAAAGAQETKAWTDKFDLASCVWTSRGRNAFFILEPGDQAVFEGREANNAVRLVITVMDVTKVVDGVETRVVEERESHNGQLAEVSRNFFAVCGPTNDVFYFGEDVDLYEGGKLSNHEGSWTAGMAGARPGLFMPSRPLLGARCYQEIAPKVAMDRVEFISDSETLKTPAGEFKDCLKTEETTPLEPGVKDYKVYARGIGMIQDGALLLTKHASVASKNP